MQNNYILVILFKEQCCEHTMNIPPMYKPGGKTVISACAKNECIQQNDYIDSDLKCEVFISYIYCHVCNKYIEINASQSQVLLIACFPELIVMHFLIANLRVLKQFIV